MARLFETFGVLRRGRRRSRATRSTQTGRHRSLRVESLEGRRLLSITNPFAPDYVEAVNPPVDWTFMVYLDGDNDLEDVAVEDFLEMSASGSDANVNVVVQFDRIDGYDSSYDDWTGTRRGLVSAGDVPDSLWGTSIGEANMGSVTTLIDFVDWGMTTYPASNYALVLWDHGGGWRASEQTKGACWDDTDGGDYLDNREVSSALATVPHLDLFGYDCCLMAMLECAHIAAGEADVFVASEQTEPGDGWPYDTVLDNLKANSTWSAAQLGADIVAEYGASYGGAETLSAIDLAEIAPDGLSDELSTLATTIMAEATVEDYDRLQMHRDNAPYFSDSDYRDLGTWLEAVADDTTLTPSIATAAADALAAYDNAVIANHSSVYDGGTGLSIYFQPAGEDPDPDYNGTVLGFADDTQWDEFLSWWADPIWPGPDLKGTLTKVDPIGLRGLTTTELTFEVSNIGITTADVGEFEVEFFFSDDPDFDNGDEIEAELDSSDPNYNSSNTNAYLISELLADSTLSDTITIALPASDPFNTDGQYYLGMRIDDAEVVAEFNESNNHSQGVGLDMTEVNWFIKFYTRDFDTDPGWSTEGQWEYGQPWGLGGDSFGNPDPSGGYTGTNVYGVNLFGDYDTTVGGPYYLTTTPINCTGYGHVTLDFRRWLNSDYAPFVNATIDVSNNGTTWTTVYANPEAETIDDDWQIAQYDISSVADDQETVYVRWGYEIAIEGAFEYSGWNLDDVTLSGMPSGPDIAGPRVTSHTPNGSVGGEQTSVTFSFSETMDTTSFDPAEDIVSFDGPAGDLTSQIAGYTWIDARTLEVQFDPQTDFGIYTLVIGPAITDNGPSYNLMNQDGDAYNGELDDDFYAATFHIADISTETFTNSEEITIPDSGSADPYPSVITVEDMEGKVIDVNVTLHGLSHTYPDDIDILLVSPSGEAALIMSDAGSSTPVYELELTLDDEATLSLPDGAFLTAGTFKPTNYDDDDVLSSPAPAGPYEYTFAAFDVIDPNGEWSLYVYDDSDYDAGYIAEGWSLTITTAGYDFGDAPDPTYPTLHASGGARHAATGPMLGWVRDAEPDGQPTSGADGDDLDSTFSDEDGVVFTSGLVGGEIATVDVTASDVAYLNAWIDFNADGDWDDPGEQIFVDEPVAPGVNSLSYYVTDTPPDATYGRFRLSTITGLSYDGTAPDGEVEDYAFGAIAGSKWNDLNDDGNWDGSEPGLAGWTIFVDWNHNGAFDPGEPSDVTAADGSYLITGLPEGTYTVAETQRPGWAQTYPGIAPSESSTPAGEGSQPSGEGSTEEPEFVGPEYVGPEFIGPLPATSGQARRLTSVARPDVGDEQYELAVDPPADPEPFVESAAADDTKSAPYELEDTFLLHSHPGATKVIYLDFDGHTTTGTPWNNNYGDPIVTPPYSLDGDDSFSEEELERIQRVWERVAEDFIPFDVDVTTEDPGVEALRKYGAGDVEWGIRVVIGENTWYGSAGGVAYVGSFTSRNDVPCFVFNSGEVGVAEAATHEVGHTLGLRHDGDSSLEYYPGHGSGATGWAPIMGVGYSKQLVQWSQGEYPDANNQEDDLAIITTYNGFTYRPDDVGDTFASSSRLSVLGASVFAEGIIGQNTDVDYFSFATGAGLVTLEIDPFYRSANLDVLATLYDASGVIATSNPIDALDASFSVTLSAGTYFLAIEGTGKPAGGDPGYSDYGSLGYYSISGTIVTTGMPGTHTVVLGPGETVYGVDFGNHELDPEMDYGDAPDGPYPTLLENDGARHTAIGPTLGVERDLENDGQPAAMADGDDATGAADDEDGVVFVESSLWASTALANTTATVDVELRNADSLSNKLDAWIDFNGDGDWDDPGEQIFTNFDLGVSDGIQTLTFTIPKDTGDNIEYGQTYARFRLSTAGELEPIGAADDGEVEDHLLTLTGYTPLPGDANLSGTVDADDAEILATYFGGYGMSWTQGDFNGDERVDLADASIMAANWGATVAEQSTEPVAPLIGPIAQSATVVRRQLTAAVRSIEPAAIESASATASDAALAQEYGPASQDQAMIQRYSLAWSNTLARRQSERTADETLEATELAIDQVLANRSM